MSIIYVLAIVVVGIIAGVAASGLIGEVLDTMSQKYFGYNWNTLKRNVRLARRQMQRNKLKYDAEKVIRLSAEDYEVW